MFYCLDSDHFRRTPCVEEGKEAHAKARGIESEPEDWEWQERHRAWCSREQTWRAASGASQQWSAAVTPSAVGKRRGTDKLHRDRTEVSSSRNLSATLTLETAPGYSATSGSPPCCDIVAHTFGLRRLILPSPSLSFGGLCCCFCLLVDPSCLSSLCLTFGGVDY